MNLLLESLIQEYKDLKVKLDKVADLILMYGGEIPHATPNVSSVETTVGYKGLTYPSQGTWKEKIMFVLKVREGEPITAKEIAKILEVVEGQDGDIKLGTDHILKTVTQYTSSMFKNGEIGADDSGFRNKYFLNN